MEELLEKKEYLSSLYDIYKSLLTEKQRTYFEDYYFLDLSLSEIADNQNVSRNAVFDSLKNISSLLNEYENKLQIYKRQIKLDAIIDKHLNSEIQEVKELIEEIKEME